MMKRLFFISLCLGLAGRLIALPISNPSQASLLCNGVFFDSCVRRVCIPITEQVSCRIGYQGSFIYSQPLEVRVIHSDIEHFSLFTNALYLYLNYFNRIDVFGSLGATNTTIVTNAATFGGPNGERLKIGVGSDTSWSIGVQTMLYRYRCLSFGLRGEFFGMRPPICEVFQGDSITFCPGSKVQLQYHAWQVGFGSALRLETLYPYMAVSWSSARIDMDDRVLNLGPNEITLYRLKNQKVFGYTIGVSKTFCSKMSVSVEGRFFDQSALNVDAQVRF